MTRFLFQILRFLVTALVVMGAFIAGDWLWVHYREDPWTRDGRVRADTVQVAPDVPGLVTEVLVHDDQQVKIGQKLFVIDRPRYELAVRQAQAALLNWQSALAEAKREDARNNRLGDLVGNEARDQGHTKVEQDEAALAQAQVNLDLAQLNLSRTEVIAQVNGVVTNLELRPGSYLTAGHPGLALIDSDSLHVDGYFEETKLPHIHIGDKVSVWIMGEQAPLYGHVENIAAGIEDRERTPTASLLANVNPTFGWVRLAQRIPVRVKLDNAPSDVRLIAGRTATVTVLKLRPVAARKTGQ